jgi:hypothetical protein
MFSIEVQAKGRKRGREVGRRRNEPRPPGEPTGVRRVKITSGLNIFFSGPRCSFRRKVVPPSSELTYTLSNLKIKVTCAPKIMIIIYQITI